MASVFKRIEWILTLMVWILSATTASGQTTIFTYQGKLTESGVPANRYYEFEFTLFDALTLFPLLRSTRRSTRYR